MCKHHLLWIDTILPGQGGFETTCLHCHAAVQVSVEQYEQDYTAYESTEPPDWRASMKRRERDAVLIHRSLLED